MCTFKEKSRSSVQLFLFYTKTTKTSWTWQTQKFSLWESERSIELNTPPTHVPKYLVPWQPAAGKLHEMPYIITVKSVATAATTTTTIKAARVLRAMQCQQGGSRGVVTSKMQIVFDLFPALDSIEFRRFFFRWSLHVFFFFSFVLHFFHPQLETVGLASHTQIQPYDTYRNSGDQEQKQSCMRESTQCGAVSYASHLQARKPWSQNSNSNAYHTSMPVWEITTHVGSTKVQILSCLCLSRFSGFISSCFFFWLHTFTLYICREYLYFLHLTFEKHASCM